MSFLGRNVSQNWINLEPQSSDPASPNEGDVYRSNGTPRPVGLWEYRNSSWQKIGSDVASESLIIGDDATFEGSVGAWLTYADAAGTQPVDGTGGSPSITFARTTTGGEILNGAASAKLSKTAANRQGQGASLTLSVPELYRGKPVNLKFFYKATANFDYGTFSDFTADPSDIIVQVYDVTNAQLLNPLPQALDGSGAYSNLLQIPTNCTSLRVILHIATTNALAWDFIVDDFTLEVALDQFLKADSDEIIAGPINITATTTNPTKPTTREYDVVSYRKIGNYAHITYRYYASNTAGAAAGSGTYLFQLPDNLVLDTSLQPTTSSSTVDNTLNVGLSSPHSDIVIRSNTGPTAAQKYFISFFDNRRFFVYADRIGATATFVISNTAFPLTEVIAYNFSIIVPIVGWTSGNLHPASVGLNSPAVMRAYKNGGAISANTTIPSWTLVEKDTTSSFNASTGIYTVRSPGDYEVNINLQKTVASGQVMAIRRNGTVIATGSLDVTALYNSLYTIIPNCTYGDTITVEHTGAATVASNNTATVLSIQKIANATQPYAPRIAYIKDVQASGTAGGSSTSGAYQTRVLNNLTGDTSFITLASNQFTLQPGTYHIEAMAPSNASVNNKIKIRNITDSLDVAIGTSMTNGNAGSAFTVSVQPTLIGTFSITSAKVFELQHRVSSSRATDGYGSATSFGDSEIYAQIKVTKVL